MSSATSTTAAGSCADPVNFNDPSGLTPGGAENALPDCVYMGVAMDQMTCVFLMGGGGDQSSGGGGAPAWLTAIRTGLQTIKGGDFTSKSKCNEFLSALAAMSDSDVDLAALQNEIKSVAGDATNYIYDGTSANTVLSQDKFPDVASPGINTVSQWFAADGPGSGSYASPLSQSNGAAIWVRPGDFQGLLGTFNSGSTLNQEGLGTMMHEILHKEMVGGSFSHDQMKDALIKVGAYSIRGGGTDISYSIGKICF